MQIEFQELSIDGNEPVTLDEAKAYIRVNFSNEDDITDDHITAARELIEGYLDRSLIQRTAKARFYDFEEWDYEGPESSINREVLLRLPFAPVDEITSVALVDEDGTSTQQSNYKERGLQEKQVKLSVANPNDEVHITYTAGASSDAGLKVAIMRLIGEMNESRQLSVFDMTVNDLPLSLEKSLAPYKRHFI